MVTFYETYLKGLDLLAITHIVRCRISGKILH